VMIAGFIDDRYALGATPKFAFETVAAWLLAKYGGAMLVDLGELVGPQRLALGAIALPFTVFAVVGVMNAVNMSDGMDGCAAGLTIMATVWFTLAAAIAGRTVELEVASALLGLLLAFLLFNAHLPHRPSALVFMGDAGSYFIGLVLAWLAIRLAMGETPAFAPMTAVWILGIPLADAVVLLVRRPLRGRNPFRADNEHLHDLLRARGYSYGQIFSLLLAASFAMGAAGFGAERAGVPSYVMFYLYGVLWIAYYAYTSTFFSRRRRR
jgi:UDP-GlcNAc:undecaprenyl-phosphate GlcNAc-1-phosphate transferase